jgi:hypothetical protein
VVELQGKAVIVDDIADQLPRHPTKSWPKRTSAIKSLTVHHSGGSTKREGLLAAQSDAKFSTQRDDPETAGLEGHDWPGCPYTFFVPFKPEIRQGKLVVYRCNADDRRTYHADAWNNESVSVCFQGSFYSTLNHLGIQPSGWQEAAWKELWPYLAERYSLDAFEAWPHGWRGKPSCPGDRIVYWLVSARWSDPTRISSERDVREALALALDDTSVVSDRGSFSLRVAVERFQKKQWIADAYGKQHRALKVDGCFGPATESMLRRELKRLGGPR